MRDVPAPRSPIYRVGHAPDPLRPPDETDRLREAVNPLGGAYPRGERTGRVHCVGPVRLVLAGAASLLALAGGEAGAAGPA